MGMSLETNANSGFLLKSWKGDESIWNLELILDLRLVELWILLKLHWPFFNNATFGGRDMAHVFHCVLLLGPVRLKGANQKRKRSPTEAAEGSPWVAVPQGPSPNRISPNFQQATNFRTEGTKTAGKRQNFVTLWERMRLSALFFLTFLVLGFSGHHDFRHVSCCPFIAQWENGPCGKTPNLKGRPKKKAKNPTRNFWRFRSMARNISRLDPRRVFLPGRFCTGEVVFWVACFAGLVSQSSFVLRPDRA